MNISFKVLTYTNASSIEEWQYPNKKEVDREGGNIFIDKVEGKSNVIGKLSIAINVIFLLLYIDDYMDHLYIEGNDFYLNIFLVSIVWTIFYYVFFVFFEQFNNYKVETKIYQAFRYFGQGIHFLDDRIKISSPIAEDNQSFLYSEVQDMIVCFKQIDVPDWTKITVFRWNAKGKSYQYTIDSLNREEREKLINVLGYLYEKSIPIKEINEDGKDLYLLEVVDGSKREIDVGIQKLIDEIGE